jgi:hypothetical protein
MPVMRCAPHWVRYLYANNAIAATIGGAAKHHVPQRAYPPAARPQPDPRGSACDGLVGISDRRDDLARRKGLPSVEDQTIDLDCAVVLYPRMSLPIASPAWAPDEGAVVHSARPVRIELFHRAQAEVTPAKALRCLRSRSQPVPLELVVKALTND